MPILSWIGKEAIVNHDKEVPFRLLKKIKGLSIGESENLIIEGDNLEGLKALLPFYQNKIKCIYIDPPYNTGHEKWIYNDNVNSPKIRSWLGKIVDDDDLTKHDKWLCLMYPRLKLLKELLCDDGVIFISIDDNELQHLKFICDEIFMEKNLLSVLIWDLGTGTQAGHFTRSHEYIVSYAKNKNNLKNFSGGVGEIDHSALKIISYKNPASNFTFPKGTRFGAEDGFELKGTWGGAEQTRLVSGRMICKNGKLGEDVTLEAGWAQKKQMQSWFSKKETIDTKGQKVLEFYFNRNGVLRYRKERTIINPKSVIDDAGSTKSASDIFKEILGNSIKFDYPKPVNLIKKLLELVTEKNSIVLDSFAGSGTTGQAVLELNEEDDGERKFVLIEMESDICKQITARRVKHTTEAYISVSNKSNTSNGFQYCVLSKPLFDKDGKIDEDCTFEDLASYIYFTETKTILDKNKISKNFIGENSETKYYLIFREIGKNTLTTSFLKGLDKESRKVIYADNCTVSEDELERRNIVFKQIPYEVRVF